MVFDGINWGDYPDVAPYAYQPRAPFGPDPVQRGLIAGYLSARRNGVFIASQTYGFNGFRVNEGGTNIASLSMARIMDTYAYIEAGFTHLVADIIFVVQTPIDTTAHHRILMNDGTSTKTGATVNLAIAAGQFDFTEAFAQHYSALDLASEQFLRARCEVDISAQSLPNHCNVWVEGNADGAGASLVATYRAGLVVVTAEVRG